MGLLRGTVIFVLVVFCSLIMTSSASSAERKLLVVGEEFAPFEFVQDGKVVGIDIDIATFIFNKMEIPVEFKIQPWKRAWRNAETGRADAILTTSRKDKRKPFLWYPKEDMWVSAFGFLVRKDKVQPDFEGYKTAIKQKLKIGVVNGNSYKESFWKAFPYKNGAITFQGDLAQEQLNDQLDGVTKFELSVKKLAGGRLDLVISDKIVGLYTAKLLGVRDQITYYEPPLYSKGYPMPFIKKSTYPGIEDIAKKFEQELRALKQTKEYQKIFKKWLN